MFEDSEKARDTIKFTELPPDRQEDYQVFAMQQIVMGLMLYLKEPLLEHLSGKEVGRELDSARSPVQQTTEIKGFIPTPREVREMIRPDTFWAISGIDPLKYMEAVQLAERVARLLYEKSPTVP